MEEFMFTEQGGPQQETKLTNEFHRIAKQAGHSDYMLMYDNVLQPTWSRVQADPKLAEQAHREMAKRLDQYFRDQGLQSEVSGIAATDINCVWLTCSLRAWERARTDLGLVAWSNPGITSANPPAGNSHKPWGLEGNP